jgi:hypothetical protein
MSEKYIRQNNGHYSIIRKSKGYGRFDSLDDAILIRNFLVENDWNIVEIENTIQIDDCWLVIGVIDEKIHILGRFNQRPSQKTINELYKKRLRNPNNSRYGLNITRIFDTYIIKKRIAGDDYIFGYYESLEDAEFVRNHLLENDWDVSGFSQIHYDEESDDYKVVEVIDDRVYVLDTFKSRSDINLQDCRRQFLNKIAKHRLGLEEHPSLDELREKIAELEEEFNMTVRDDTWELKDTSDPLNDIIFNLTPFQKSVYDAVDNSTVEDIEKSLVRFRSGNFTQKIRKNLDELEKMGMIYENNNRYIKRNP